MSPSRLVGIALVIGVVAGCIAAISIPRSDDVARTPGPPRVAPARVPDPHEPTLVAVPGSVRVELERRDPQGGPAWVVRSLAVRYPDRPGGPTEHHRSCVQLLRRHQGRLGWIDGDNVFRPLARDYGRTQLACGSRFAPSRGEPFATVVTVLTGISQPDPQPIATVVFGAGGTPARGAELRVDGKARHPALSRRGAFLEFVQTGSEPSSVSFRYPRRVEAALKVESSWPFIGSRVWRAGGGEYKRLVVQARAADPNGGPPWAIAARRGMVGWCHTQPARIVGGRFGSIDFSLGTFALAELPPGECFERRSWGQRRPLSASASIGGSEPDHLRTSSKRGPIEHRTLSGKTFVWGAARSDVREITFTTPRDIRTIVPSGPAHAWLVVYDGRVDQFAVTARFADGSSRVVELFPRRS
jgi:hypothetical protein